MAKAKITLLGLFEYDPTIFSDMVLPELPSSWNKDDLVNNILLEAMDYEALYPDPDLMKNVIYLWSKKWYATFERWIKTMEIEYNPEYNFDKTVHWLDEGTTHGSADVSDGTQNDNYVTPYESDTLHQETRQTGTQRTQTTNDVTVGNTHDGREFGNIGVTTTQQLLMSELELAEFNIMQRITDFFIADLTIPVM